MVKISNYLDPRLLFFLNVESREEALHALIDGIYTAGKIENKSQFYNSIIAREEIVSTGIGMGVALPHAKTSEIDDFFIAIGILQKGIEWKSLDGAEVRIIFLIGGPDDKQTQYLQLLSGLTLAIKDEKQRKKILTLNSPKDIIELFKEY